jgi:hypothetical protein
MNSYFLADLFLYSYEADFIQGLWRIPQIQIGLLHTLTYTSKWRLRTKLYDKRDDFNFPIVNFPFICNNIPAAPAYGVYITQLIWYSRACCSYQDFLDRGLLLTRKLLNHGFPVVKLKSSLLSVLRLPPWRGWPLWNICVTDDHGYVPLVVSTSQSFPHSWLTTGVVARLTRRVPIVEQELLTLQEHLISSPVFSGVRVTRSLVLCVYFVDLCLSFCTFSFGHCVVCSSSIYGFWLPLWYLQTLLIVYFLNRDFFGRK